MNTDVLDLFVRQLGLDGADQQSLKLQIALTVVGRAAAQLGERLSPDEHETIKKFISESGADTQDQMQKLFSAPDRQSVLTASFLAVLQDLIDDPEVVAPERRETVLGEMDQFLESKQALV